MQEYKGFCHITVIELIITQSLDSFTGESFQTFKSHVIWNICQLTQKINKTQFFQLVLQG